MKRSLSLFALIIHLATCSLVHLSAVSAASQYDSNKNIATGVLQTVSGGVSKDLNLGSIFSFDDNFGQDIYKYVYTQVKSEGSDIAVERALNKHPISQEELALILPGSDLNYLLKEPDPKKNLTAGEVEARKKKFEEELSEEKLLADLEVLAKMEVQNTELFANGDEGDSGFDLLADLAIIEALLFGATETSLSNTGPGNPAGTNTARIPGGSGSGSRSTPPSSTPAQNPSPSPSLVTAPSTTRPQPASSPLAASPGTTQATSSQSLRGDEEATVCPVNKDFHEAVERAQVGESATQGESGRTGFIEQTGSADSIGTSARGQTAGSAQSARTATQTPGAPLPARTPDGAYAPHDWKLTVPCSEIFCLTVDLVYKKATAYQSKDNCIACHFEKINDLFKKTLDKNLVPSKATGNLLEGSKCKKSMFNLGFSIVAVSQPILTPPNDDLVVKGDFIGNFEKFLEKITGNPGRCTTGTDGKARCKDDPDVSREVAARVLEQAGEGSDYQAILRDIRVQVDAIRQEAQKEAEKELLSASAEDTSAQYRALIAELDQMNSYFKAFQKLFTDLVQKSASGEDPPCSRLLSKEQCS